ncbi:MAG: hypothetical protein ACFFDN_43175, partial [Candidatus Hodarchaeota archaeon]
DNRWKCYCHCLSACWQRNESEFSGEGECGKYGAVGGGYFSGDGKVDFKKSRLKLNFLECKK